MVGFSSGGTMGGGTFTLRSPKPYPTTPPPLAAADIAQFGQRRRQVSRDYEQALARQGAGKAEIDGFFAQFVNRMDRERRGTQRETMQGLGARGTARDPRFAGRALKNIRDEYADQRGEADLERASQLGALQQMVNETRTTRDDELTAINADEARRRSELDRLLRQVGA